MNAPKTPLESEQIPGSDRQKLYDKLIKQTGDHINYLTRNNLGERAKAISVRWFKSQEQTSNTVRPRLI